jgi:hypothetical protein
MIISDPCLILQRAARDHRGGCPARRKGVGGRMVNLERFRPHLKVEWPDRKAQHH